MAFQYSRVPKPTFTAILAAFSVLTLIACGDSTTTEESYKRVIPTDKTFTINDFEAAGIKTTRQYDVTDLPSATDAWFGFRRVSGTDPTEFEMRFYPDHDAAINEGVSFAEDATGKDANLVSTNAAWVEGIQDRSTRFPFGAGYTINAKYLDYFVYGNTVLLCEGETIEESRDACNWLIEQLETANQSQ